MTFTGFSKVLMATVVVLITGWFIYGWLSGDNFLAVTNYGTVMRWCASGDERLYAFNVGNEQKMVYYVDMKARTASRLDPTVRWDEVCPLAVPVYPVN